MDEVKQDTVEMTIPVEQLEPTHEVDQQGKVKCLTCSQILDNIELFNTHYAGSHGVLPTSDPQEETASSEAVEVKTEEILTNPQEEVKEEQPQRNEKGQFTPGNNASEGKGGNTCDFCKRPVEVMQKIQLFSHWTRGKVDGKLHIPLLEDLCDEDYLDIDEDTLTNWTKHPHDELIHAELIRAVKRLFMRQKGFYKKRALSDKNPSGAIFLLKANHGLIETEKQMLVGGNNNDGPIKYDINIIPKKKREELEGE